MPARRKARSVTGKPGRLDDMGLHAQAGAQPKYRAGVLGNVRLVKGNSHRINWGSLPVELWLWRNPGDPSE